MQECYYQHEIDTGAIVEDRPVYLAIHTGENEHASLDLARLEAPYLSGPQERAYVHAKPFILEPRYFATVAWDSAQGRGEIIDSEQKGVQEHYIGNAQAWHYAKDDVLVLWECYLYEPYRSGPPEKDDAHVKIWTSFDDWLTERFDPGLILSPAWEPVYEAELWQEFLRSRGYEIRENLGMKKRKRI